MKNEYPIIVFYSEDDECYIADIPDLKHCSAFGDTPQEALEEVLIAKEAWLEAAKANNISVPQPRFIKNQIANAFQTHSKAG